MQRLRVVLPLLLLVCLAVGFVIWHSSRNPVQSLDFETDLDPVETSAVSSGPVDTSVRIANDHRSVSTAAQPETSYNPSVPQKPVALPLPPAFGFSYPRVLTGEMLRDAGTDIHPALATDGAGTWMVAWAARSGDESPYGNDYDIFAATTRDDGSTWSGTNAVNTNARTDSGNDCGIQNGPAIGYQDGVWMTLWDSNESFDGRLGEDSDIFYAVSLDAGASWSQPLPVHESAASDSMPDVNPVLLPVGGGQWVAAWETTEDLGGKIGTDRDLVYATFDATRSEWSEAKPLNANADRDRNADKNVAIETDGRGNLVAVWESNEDADGLGIDLDLFYARSTDGGQSWGAANALNADARGDLEHDSFAAIGTNREGRWLVVWVGKNPTDAELGKDADLMFSTSDDDGRTWYPPQPLTELAATDSRPDYLPSIAYDGQDNWVVVWESLDEAGIGLGTDSDILVSRSTDQGLTWTRPTGLHPDATTDDLGDFGAVIEYGNGVWMVIYASKNPQGGSGSDQDLFQVTSDNLDR